MNSDQHGVRRGARRRPIVAAEQAQRNQRRQQRHTEARARQQRIDAADKSYCEAADMIVAIDAELGERLAELDARALRLREDADARASQQRRLQTQAVVDLRQEGCKVEEIATILDLPAPQVRAYLAEHRRAQASADIDADTTGTPHSGSDACWQDTADRATAAPEVDTTNTDASRTDAATSESGRDADTSGVTESVSAEDSGAGAGDQLVGKPMA